MHLHSLLCKNMYFWTSTRNLEVVQGQFFENQWEAACFLAPAKLPRSAILENFVNKIKVLTDKVGKRVM